MLRSAEFACETNDLSYLSLRVYLPMQTVSRHFASGLPVVFVLKVYYRLLVLIYEGIDNTLKVSRGCWNCERCSILKDRNAVECTL
jgi:hypothetical protein